MKEYNTNNLTEEEICKMHDKNLLRLNFKALSKETQLHEKTLRRHFGGTPVRPLVAAMIQDSYGIVENEPARRVSLKLWWRGAMKLDYPRIAKITGLSRQTVQLFFESDATAQIVTIRTLVKTLGLSDRQTA